MLVWNVPFYSSAITMRRTSALSHQSLNLGLRMNTCGRDLHSTCSKEPKQVKLHHETELLSWDSLDQPPVNSTEAWARINACESYWNLECLLCSLGISWLIQMASPKGIHKSFKESFSFQVHKEIKATYQAHLSSLNQTSSLKEPLALVLPGSGPYLHFCPG